MRLKDVDKLHYINKTFYDMGSATVVFAKEIDKAPTVDAIPKEWIEKYCDRAIESYTKMGNEDAVKVWQGYVIPVITVMIKHWEREKENE